MGRAVAGLSLALVVAFLLWRRRPPRPDWQPDRLLTVYFVGIVVQLAHFVEELATGFASAFPTLVGLDYTWTEVKFITCNLAWLAVFGVAAWCIHRRWTGALVVAWLFAIVAIANGVLHVAATLLQGGYFPGVVTALVLFDVGILLLRRLVDETSADKIEATPPGRSRPKTDA